RRHTESYGDWSSDVCSSDLKSRHPARLAAQLRLFSPERCSCADSRAGCRDFRSNTYRPNRSHFTDVKLNHGFFAAFQASIHDLRSEERRVGKECSTRLAAAP